MTIRVTHRRASRGLNWQVRAQQLEQELLTERQSHVEALAAVQGELLTCAAARDAAEDRVLVLERTVKGLREQLETEKREHATFLRRHGLGDHVPEEPKA